MNKPLIRTSFANKVLVVLTATVVGTPVHAGATTASEVGHAGTLERYAAAVAHEQPEVAQALHRDLGLDRVAAAKRVAQEAAAATAQQHLKQSLGGKYGGSWFDPAAGRLIVAITDAGLSAAALEAGAYPTVARYSLDTLNAIKDDLDELSRRKPSAATGLVEWRVDERTNSVVVTTLKGRPAGELLDAAIAHGPAVRIETATDAPRLTREFLDGGEAITNGNTNLPCSVGFNAVIRWDATSQSPIMITAGHCAEGSPVRGFNGVVIGNWWLVDRSRDWGITGVDTNNWAVGPWVSQFWQSDVPIVVRGHQQRPIGSVVCKSGVTTHVTCGTIRARNETVNYPGFGIVYGLSSDTAYAQSGDSGGPHLTTDNHAQGIQSGTSFGPNCPYQCQYQWSWYQEINYILAYTGSTLLTSP